MVFSAAVSDWLAEPVGRAALAASATALIGAAWLDTRTLVPLICGSGGIDWTGLVERSQLIFALNRPTLLAAAWLAMLVAMMAPLAVIPMRYIARTSLTTRRNRAAAVFATGYFGGWMLAGPVLLSMAILIRLAAPNNLAAFALALAFSLAWSASPFSQAARNRAHHIPRIGLFGLAADRDCALYGARLAARCVVACWPWMILPLLAPQAHVATMAFAALIVLAEDLRGPGRPRWRRPFPLNLVRRPLPAIVREKS